MYSVLPVFITGCGVEGGCIDCSCQQWHQGVLGLVSSYSFYTSHHFQGRTQDQGVKKRCRLSWLTKSALRVWAQMRGGEGVPGSQPMSTAVHMSPNKVWRSNSLFNLWEKTNICRCREKYRIHLAVLLTSSNSPDTAKDCVILQVSVS
jgi:hypothetical protein